MKEFRSMSRLVKTLFIASIVCGVVTIVLIIIGFSNPWMNTRPGIVPTFIFLTVLLSFITFGLGGGRRRYWPWRRK
ncbi:hypothetical protein [Arthrobacter sp. H14]|uniref:hypothetical protein n=1 Tax=Arthrobacter sp. H14 TaxID=1312959 RepID=UPI0012DF950E|nr:hypothetical protein [Arthrobacter sp. H14]